MSKFARPFKSRCLPVCLLLFSAGAYFLPCNALAARRIKIPKESRRSEAHEIELLEEQWRSAIVRGDATSMGKLLADDFLAISAHGTLSDKQQYLQRIASRTTQLSSFDLMDMKVRVNQTSAVTVSQAHIVGTLEGKPIEGVFRYTKVFSRLGAGWLMTNFEATKVSAAPGSGDMDRGVPLNRNNGDTSHPH